MDFFFKQIKLRSVGHPCVNSSKEMGMDLKFRGDHENVKRDEECKEKL